MQEKEITVRVLQKERIPKYRPVSVVPGMGYSPKLRFAAVLIVFLGIIVLGVVFMPSNRDSGQLYAAVVQQFQDMETLSYTVVLSTGVEIDIPTESRGWYE